MHIRSLATPALAILSLSAAIAASACDDASTKPAPAGSAAATAAASASAVASVALPPMPPAAPLPTTQAFMPEMKIPADNELTAAKATLGKQLFFDKRLSKDGSASCETCHVPEKGWG